MRIVFAFVLLCGLGLAGSAAYMVMQKFNEYETQIAKQKRELDKAAGYTNIVVVKDSIREGTQITADHVEVMQWPADSMPEGAFVDVESIVGPEDTAPRIALRFLEKGEPLTIIKLSDFGERPTIRSILSEGMRGFDISLNQSVGASGNLRTGYTVDVLWTGNTQQGKVTQTILENLSIIGTNLTPEEEFNQTARASRVTLQITPEEVSKLTYAVQSGNVTLSLRGIDDNADINPQDVNLVGLTGLAAPVAPAPAAEERKCYVTVMKGGQRVQEEVPCPRQ